MDVRGTVASSYQLLLDRMPLSKSLSSILQRCIIMADDPCKKMIHAGHVRCLACYRHQRVCASAERNAACIVPSAQVPPARFWIVLKSSIRTLTRAFARASRREGLGSE